MVTQEVATTVREPNPSTPLLAPHGPRASRPGRRERRRAETRERLSRAALALFAERGFTATTVEDITEAADVGKGTFFNYFPSKEHVLGGFAETQLGKLQEVVEEAKQKKEPMRAALQRLARRLAEEPGRSPALVRGMLVANLSSEPIRRRMQENLGRGRRLLADLLALGQERGEIRRDHRPIELARVFQQSFFGVLVMWSFHPAAPLRIALDAAFPLLWSGIGAGSAVRRKEKRI